MKELKLLKLTKKVFPELNNTDVLIFLEITKNEYDISVMEIADSLNKDRTTIQKILIKLLKMKLITKRQINLDRGFKFLYRENINLYELLKINLKKEYENNSKILENLKK